MQGKKRAFKFVLTQQLPDTERENYIEMSFSVDKSLLNSV